MKIKSRDFRLRNLYKIVTKSKQVVQFVPNKIQDELLAYKRACKKAKKRFMYLCLKARQGGITTEECIYGLDRVVFYSNQRITLTAHTIEKAREIFGIIKFAYDNMPARIVSHDGTVWEKPVADTNNVGELAFGRNNSSIKVVRDTRSGTPSQVHVTEMAFMDNAEEMYTALMGGETENMDIGIETTANGTSGIGAVFYHLWKDNHGKAGARFKTFFFPWYSMDDYESDIPLKELSDDYYWSEKQKYVPRLTKLWLPERKISWYVQKAKSMLIASRNGGKAAFVEQEFPSTAEEAFLVSSRTVFDMTIVRELEAYVQSMWKSSVYDSMYQDLRFYSLDAKWKPKGEKNIAIGVDVSEGTKDGDYTTIVWRRRSDLKLLFTYRGKIKPGMVGAVLNRIYAYGFQGLIGIERNNHGHAAILSCEQFNLYYDLYVQKTLDKKFNTETSKLGWLTTGASKSIIVSRMEAYIREGLIYEFDYREWQELQTFLNLPDGSMGAVKPEHDDTVMADAICLEMAAQKFDKIS